MRLSIGHLLRQHYWAHINLYPIHFRLSDDDEKELMAKLAYSCLGKSNLYYHLKHPPLMPLTGNTRSTVSNVPYNRNQCEAFLRLIRGFPSAQCAEAYRNLIIARLWFGIDRNHFVKAQRQETVRRTNTQRLMYWINIGLTLSPLIWLFPTFY